MNIKVITYKSKATGYKYLIGFSSDPTAFVMLWLVKRPQFTNFTEHSPTHFSAVYEGDTHDFYATRLTDGETCSVSLNDNCMGFNDNH